MGEEAIALAQHVLLIFAAIFFVGTVTGKAADLLKVPDVVLYLVTGIIIGPPGLGFIDVPASSTLNQLTLIIGAAFLLFHGGTGVSLKILKSVWLTLLLLSTLAVLVMVAVVGYAAHAVLGISLISALLLAAVLASTDPATLVPIFLSVKIKERVAQTVLSESAFNDATGAIVTFTVLGVMTTGQLSLGGSLSKFIIMAGGGILIGVLYGLCAAFLISKKSGGLLAEYAHALILPVIIAAYITADHLETSGFMAVFVAGLVYGNMEYLGWKMAEKPLREMHSFIESGSLLLRMTIFILLGTHVDFSVIKEHLLPGCIIVAVFMFIARPLAVLCCTLPDRLAKWRKNEILFMFWTRETGVIPAALSGMLVGMNIENANIIASITFMAILATLVIQASTTKWLAKKLNLLDDR
ncbi:MAG: sodium:proton antiporter [Pelosinus sp.]|nr:sodium:proton antiporter [Pelosinus sp.]